MRKGLVLARRKPALARQVHLRHIQLHWLTLATEPLQDRQKTVLTMEDLSAALQEYGINCTRAPYYL